jgi:serine protease Do
LGSTSTLSLGEWVIAVGNNKRDDFSPAISVGVISGKDRRYYNDEYRESYYELNGLVADLKVSEGLTGGVVINMQGELVGIPSSVLSSDDAVIVPVEEVVEVVRLILEYKEVVRPVLGISTQKISEMTAYQKSQLGIQLDQIDGLYIHSIKRNGSCDLAQIQSGDLLLEINGTRLADYNALRSILYTFKPQDVVELTIVRGTETMKVMVTLQ